MSSLTENSSRDSTYTTDGPTVGTKKNDRVELTSVDGGKNHEGATPKSGVEAIKGSNTAVTSGAPSAGIWFCGHFIEPHLRPTGDLARWGKRCFHPKNNNNLVSVPLVLKPVQLRFLQNSMVKFGFSDLHEVFRHLIFVSTVVETPAKKKVIFKKVREGV